MGVHVKRLVFLATAVAAAMVIVAPAAGGGTWSSGTVSTSASPSVTFLNSMAKATPKTVAAAGSVVSPEGTPGQQTQGPAPDDGHVTAKPVTKKSTARGAAGGASVRKASTASGTTKSCPGAITGSTGTAPGVTSKGGVAGTTTADLSNFAHQMNAIRVAHCLAPIPYANVKYDSCMEQRLFWMAEDPSTNPMSAWGHIGSKRSDGVPSVGCDGNLAGGSGNTGATVAQKWWDSTSHRSVEYRPTFKGSTGGVCILFAMTHGGIPNEPTSFTRAASRWVTC